MRNNLKLNELSIIIPIYNEEKNLIKLSQSIKNNLKIKKYEIIFVDDSSKDNSEYILKKLKKRFINIKYFIRKNLPRDLSKSCILGFNKSSYKNILVMDGDLQHDPKNINKLINKHNNTSSDVIVGCREIFSEQNKGLIFFRSLLSIFLIGLINITLGKKTGDPLSGFFLFKKKIFLKSQKKLYRKGYKILADIIYNSEKKLKISDVKINFRKRLYGKTKTNYKILLILISFIFRKLLKYEK